jgi:hypothetical protein
MDKFDAFWLQAKKLSLARERKERIQGNLVVYMKDAVRNAAFDCQKGDMESFWSSAQDPLLSPPRKDAIRGKLRAYAEQDMQTVQMPLHERFVWHWKILTGTIAAAFSLSGMGFCYAAESAVPGDLLYSVKVSVNEPVLGVFALSPEAKAVWQVKLTERRLWEEQVLIQRGVSPETIRSMQSAIDARLQQARMSVQTWAAQNPSAAAALQQRISTAAHTHSSLVEGIDQQIENGSTSSDSPILPLLRQKVEERRSMRLKEE